QRFACAANQKVIEFLVRERPSAHPDMVVEVMSRAAADLPEKLYYCPDRRACAYVFLHTQADVIYALAHGFSALAFRLPPTEILAAMGGEGHQSIVDPDNWVEFDAYQLYCRASNSLDGAAVEIKPWCEKAFAYAVSLSGPGRIASESDPNPRTA